MFIWQEVHILEYRMPDYYNEFECIAGDCPCTCCSGWGVYIDDRTYEKYKDCDADRKEYIMKHVDDDEQCFKICDGRCSFLNDDKLCDLIIREGESMLCDTCRRYPRHFEIYGNQIEAALSMSCPVVARMIIDRKRVDKFKVRSTDKKTNTAKKFDKRLLSILMEVRKDIFAIAKDRTKRIDQRMRDILFVTGRVQEVIYKYEKMPVKVPILADKLLKQATEFSKICPKSTTTTNALSNRYHLMKEYLDMLLGLEMINDEWPALVNDIVEILYTGCTEEQYIQAAKQYEEFLADYEYEYEHILVYFLYTYFLGGVYDGNIIGMVKMSIFSTMFIREMSLADFYRNRKKRKKQTVDKRIEHAYLYSRQIEHSDENLLSLEGILTAHPLCSVDKMASIL